MKKRRSFNVLGEIYPGAVYSPDIELSVYLYMYIYDWKKIVAEKYFEILPFRGHLREKTR